MKSFIFLLFLVLLSGCATDSCEEVAAGLKKDLGVVNHKFELAKRENLTLKKELLLFKKSQDIDTQNFILAQEAFLKVLEKDVKAGDISVHLTDKGLVVSVLSEKLFMSASDILSNSGKELLDKIAGLVSLYFKANYIYIEGHTDNQSLAVFEWKSDWEFSFARALSVLKYFSEKKGFDPLRLSASGFGQYRPKVSNTKKEGRRINRRIEIVVSPQKLRYTVKK